MSSIVGSGPQKRWYRHWGSWYVSALGAVGNSSWECDLAGRMWCCHALMSWRTGSMGASGGSFVGARLHRAPQLRAFCGTHRTEWAAVPPHDQNQRQQAQRALMRVQRVVP